VSHGRRGIVLLINPFTQSNQFVCENPSVACVAYSRRKSAVGRTSASSLLLALIMSLVSPCASAIGQTAQGQDAPQGQSQGQTAAAQPISAETRYQFFFMHLATLEKVADELDKKGKDGNLMRGYEAHAAGLNQAEEAVMKRIAFDCNQALAELDQKRAQMVQAFRAQHPDKEYFHTPLPPEMKQLQQEKITIIQSHMEELKSDLGADMFQKLDAYMQQRMASAISVANGPQAPTTQESSGAKQ